jgi:hypothetical protein
MNRPEISQDTQCVLGKRHQSIFIALGITDMHPHIHRVDIANRELNSFAQTQAHAVNGEEKHLVAQFICCGKKLIGLLDC